MSPELKAFIVFQAIDKATNIIKNIKGSIGDTVGRLQNIQDAAIAVGGATLLALKSTADSAANFESSLTPLGTVVTSTMGSMEKSLKAFASAAKEWSSLHKQSAEEFLQASYQMSSAGLNDIQAIEGTRKALALATATMGDSTEAANLLALSYNNFANKNADVTKEMSRLGDVLAKTQNLFQIANLGQLSEGLKYASSTALAAKISFEEMNTIIGMLNNVGLQGSMAGTAFSNAIAQMTKASKELGFNIAKNAEGGIDFISTIENIKDATKQMDAIQLQDALNKAFGQEGARGIALLLKQLDKLKESYEVIKNSQGTLGEAQKIMEANFSTKLKILLNNLNAIAITIGTPFVNALNTLLGLFTPIVRFINFAMDKIPGFAPLITVLMTALLGLASAVGIAASVALLKRSAFGVLFSKEFPIYIKYTKVLIGQVFSLIGVTQALSNAQKAMGIASAFGVKGIALLTTGIRAFFASLGPVFWIVLAITAITTAIILLWKNCKPFRVLIINMINAILFGIGYLAGLFVKVGKIIFGFFVSVGKAFVDFQVKFNPFVAIPLLIIKNFSKIKSFFASFWNALKSGPVGFVNWLISLVNGLISALNSFKIIIPKWIPGLGGQTFGLNIPKIPPLASGGIVSSSGLAIVGEKGPELVHLPTGAKVYSNKDSKRLGETHYHTHYNKIELKIDNIESLEAIESIFKQLERYAEASC